MEDKQYAKVFIKEFIRDGKDCDVPLNDTYIMYIDFMRNNFPSERPISNTLFHRLTTDYFYKKCGAKNNKAVSLEQLKKDLEKKQTAINRDLATLQRITKNREQLLKEDNL